MTAFRPSRIVSGGQTGVDRGALDAAIQLGIPHGGWCPLGRLSEDGMIPECYQLQEHESSDYSARTLQNVVDSDATLILYVGKLKGGTLLTRRYVRREKKPCLLVSFDQDSFDDPISDWLDQLRPETLNVAGPRESNHPGIAEQTRQILIESFSEKGHP